MHHFTLIFALLSGNIVYNAVSVDLTSWQIFGMLYALPKGRAFCIFIQEGLLMSRCLYNSSFEKFSNTDKDSILGDLCDNYHGAALTTTIEAWKGEITIMKDILSELTNKDGKIVFEYDIPRLGKRIDVVLLLEGIIFCLELKVGESRILEADVDQVLDYALDLKNLQNINGSSCPCPIPW